MIVFGAGFPLIRNRTNAIANIRVHISTNQRVTKHHFPSQRVLNALSIPCTLKSNPLILFTRTLVPFEFEYVQVHFHHHPITETMGESAVVETPFHRP